MVTIVQREDPVLRGTAKEVPIEDITGAKIQNVIKDMKEALDKEADGVAIAAPQIGVPLRIFVISGKVFGLSEDMEERRKTIRGSQKSANDLVFINPVFTKVSKDKKLLEEGCLSARYAYGKVRRATKAAVEAYDEKGAFFTRGGSGLLAQIFQHEMDHLDGVLFLDKANDLKELTPEEWEGMLSE